MNYLLAVHEGEEIFNLGWPEVVIGLSLLAFFLHLVHANKTFEVRTVRELVAILNTKGGNIMLLAMFSIYFFSKAMQFFYHGLGLMVDKKLSPENAVLMMGVAFVTGTAFGGAFGGLISLLSGEPRPGGPGARQSDATKPAENGSAAASSPTPPTP